LINNLSGKPIDKDFNEVTQKALVFCLPNRGKDLSGKLYCLNVIYRLKLKDAPVLFLHDKKSPQANNGREWKEKLFRCAAPEFAKQAVGLINKGMGIICTNEALMSSANLSEKELLLDHKEIILKTLNQLNLRLNDYSFVGGTMFWSHTKYYRPLFERIDIMDLITHFESGNVLDLEAASLTHAWERLLSYVITGQQLKITAL